MSKCFKTGCVSWGRDVNVGVHIPYITSLNSSREMTCSGKREREKWGYNEIIL